MKIALFRDIEHDWCKPHPWTEESAKHVKNMVQLSEYVDVEFPPISNGSVVQQQMDALNSQEKELRNQFQKHLDRINSRRAELQALTFVPAGE